MYRELGERTLAPLQHLQQSTSIQFLEGGEPPPLLSRSAGVVVLPSTRLGHTTLPSLRSAFMPMASVNGIKLYYEVTGSGYPLLFSHEFAGDYRSWELQVTS